MLLKRLVEKIKQYFKKPDDQEDRTRKYTKHMIKKYKTFSQALKREAEVKQWPRHKKLALIGRP
jgi:predicted GIY-YIG superfamily endonuclease